MTEHYNDCGHRCILDQTVINYFINIGVVNIIGCFYTKDDQPSYDKDIKNEIIRNQLLGTQNFMVLNSEKELQDACSTFMILHLYQKDQNKDTTNSLLKLARNKASKRSESEITLKESEITLKESEITLKENISILKTQAMELDRYVLRYSLEEQLKELEKLSFNNQKNLGNEKSSQEKLHKPTKEIEKQNILGNEISKKISFLHHEQKGGFLGISSISSIFTKDNESKSEIFEYYGIEIEVSNKQFYILFLRDVPCNKIFKGYPHMTPSRLFSLVTDFMIPINVTKRAALKAALKDREDRWKKGMVEHLNFINGAIEFLNIGILLTQNHYKFTYNPLISPYIKTIDQDKLDEPRFQNVKEYLALRKKRHLGPINTSFFAMNLANFKIGEYLREQLYNYKNFEELLTTYGKGHNKPRMEESDKKTARQIHRVFDLFDYQLSKWDNTKKGSFDSFNKKYEEESENEFRSKLFYNQYHDIAFVINKEYFHKVVLVNKDQLGLTEKELELLEKVVERFDNLEFDDYLMSLDLLIDIDFLDNAITVGYVDNNNTQKETINGGSDVLKKTSEVIRIGNTQRVVYKTKTGKQYVKYKKQYVSLVDLRKKLAPKEKKQTAPLSPSSVSRASRSVSILASALRRAGGATSGKL